MKGIIIILGSPNNEKGELGQLAIDRLSTAIALYRRHSGYKVLCTGGFGKHFNQTMQPHAYYAKLYLMGQGVDQNDILEFVLSANTVEDATKSYQIIRRYNPESIMVVTSDFHMPRVKFIFERVYSGSLISYVEVASQLAKDEKSRLTAHEQKSLNSLQRNGLYIE